MESPESPAAKSVAKRKRSKRPRPVPAAAASSASSSSAEFSSGCTAADDDDDMAANCLILLAQGRCDSPPAAADDVVVEILPAESPLPLPLPPPAARQGGGDRQNERFGGGSRRFTAGFYVYECKTCSKCFPSFQALGGHRASHKKPRLAAAAVAAAEETKDLQPFPSRHEIIPCGQNYGASSSNNNSSHNNGSKAARVHECGICGAEFGSGQALGGHMRRHRPLGATAEAAESKKKEERGSGAVLSLDLNLPAPSDDVDGRVAAFAESQFLQQQQQHHLFSASALVDCHY